MNPIIYDIFEAVSIDWFFFFQNELYFLTLCIFFFWLDDRQEFYVIECRYFVSS